MWKMPELPSFPKIPEHYKLPEDDELNDHKIIDNQNFLATDDKVNNKIYVMKENMAFNTILFHSDINLTFDVGDHDKSIVVNHLNLKNGHLKVKGKGKLTLYVREKITFGSGSTINKNGKINHVNFFIKD